MNWEDDPMAHKISKPGESLAKKRPDLAAEWDFEKNDFGPDEISCGSSEKVFWLCKNGHSFEASVAHRAYSNSGCKYCKGSGTSYPEQFIYWGLKSIIDDTKNRYIINGYEYDIYIPSKNTVIEYSADYWHNERRERDALKKKYAYDSNMNYLEIIENRYGFEFLDCITSNKQDKSLEIILIKIFDILEIKDKITDLRGIKAKAIEYSKGKKVLPEKSLKTRYPEIADDWDYDNNDTDIDCISYGSYKRVFWKCKKCHNTWEDSVNHRTISNRGCPYCTPNGRVITGENDLDTLYPNLSLEWHPTKNGNLKPTDVRAGSNKKVWWKCSKGHEWQAKIYDRAHKGSGCPRCVGRKSKGPVPVFKL